MAERTLRGMSIGARSMESEENVEYAPRLTVQYACPNGHDLSLPFSVDAEIPATWECSICGAQALRLNHEMPAADENVKQPRTHWDMLLERRSIAELEELLQERLQLLRSGQLHADRLRQRSA